MCNIFPTGVYFLQGKMFDYYGANLSAPASLCRKTRPSDLEVHGKSSYYNLNNLSLPVRQVKQIDQVDQTQK